MFPPPGPAQ
ncbi:hypothetical protein E2C01_094231 [Portunus trituberculatus]|uniref:Uncharacterized protein n=1 Tax=Portunus trituberculatus TaxID=210409 RepID=A0A5B7JX19_PORTR|nr:hypothetical protein [Portunus trituberculatus]